MSEALEAVTVNPHNPALPYFATNELQTADFHRTQEHYVTTVDLPCSPDLLFDIFEDASAWPRWVPGIGQVRWTSEKPYTDGTTRTVIFWGGMEVYETFTLWERGRSMSFTFTGITQPIWSEFGELYEIEAIGDQQCRLKWTVAFSFRDHIAKWTRFVRPFASLVFWYYMRRLRKYVKQSG